jgi:rhodanese-related sulfurtransferase
MKNAHQMVEEAKRIIHEFSPDKAEEALPSADLLLDVREPDEFRDGHIPGAINIPRGLLEFKLSSDPELENRDQKVVVYCKTSGRAALAARALKEMGYLHIFSIEGGFDAWQQAEKPVIKPTMPDFD